MIYIGFILGTILGSLSKALAKRSLTKKTFWGRSKCPKCQHTLGILDLIPVLSFILLKGKCRYCKKDINKSYLGVEIAMGFLIALLFFQYLQNFQVANFNIYGDFFLLSIFIIELIFKIFFITVLVMVFLTDIKEMLIPDRIIIPSIIIAVVILFSETLFRIGHLFSVLSQTSVGQFLLSPNTDYFKRHVIILAEPFLGSLGTGVAIALFFTILIIITKGRGMGRGDVKLGLFIGICLGFPNGFLAIILAFITGALFSALVLILRKKSLKSQIPFGPFLTVGGLLALFLGTQIISWYLGSF